MNKEISSSTRLAELMEMLRQVTAEPDPVRSSMLFVRSYVNVSQNFGLLSVSMRDLKRGEYRIARLLHQADIKSAEYPDTEFAAADAPVHTGGFIGDVIGSGKLGLLDVASVADDPVLGNRLRPYRAFVAFPIVTLGNVDNYLIQFTTEPESLTQDLIESRFLGTNLMGSLTHAKRVAMELDQANARNKRLEEQRAYLSEEIALEHRFDGIVFESAAFKRVLKKLEQVAQTDATVLILGESGTGKELLARAVHGISRRQGMPLVKVNCAALPENLIESELFGHEKGAFTGAIKDKTGRFELADGGTIFLDEVGELPLALQAKLLRVLQEGEFERIGEGRTRETDVRVIAATNRDLDKEIKDGTFREDLYYRLNVFPLVSPPLRERKEDIPALAHSFLSKCNTTMGKVVETVSTEAMQSLQSYDWPGNVRELQNIIERAVILSEGSTLEIAQVLGSTLTTKDPLKNPRTLIEKEKQFLREALEECGWRIQGLDGAAAKLDVSPSTLRSRMKRLGIARP